MNSKEIDILLKDGIYPCDCQSPQLIETHISWVILCNQYVFKIKKPIQYSFLDFSTLKKRKHFCETEIVLNRRLIEGVYLDVVSIKKETGRMSIGQSSSKGEIIEYAVRMKRLAADRRMDLLLESGKVSSTDIHAIADQLIPFHQNAKIINDSSQISIREKFNDLANLEWETEALKIHAPATITNAIEISTRFLEKYEGLLLERKTQGFIRDCHGDLHSRNIFLLPEPVVFDCIEFNDDYRQIDILNELAFFCMDLEAFGYHDLSDQFFIYYNEHFHVCRNVAEQFLFVYYKAYRANVRAKVNLLRAKSATDLLIKEQALKEAERYLLLMGNYMDFLSTDAL